MLKKIVVPVDIPLVSMNIVGLNLVGFCQSLSCFLLLVKIMICITGISLRVI